MATATHRDAVRTRKALLDGAARAITRHGAAVSLDAVAREAGVSKGGLLHHFRSKDALLAGMVEEWMARFDAAVQRHLDPGDLRPGRLCRAHIRATFDDDVDLDDEVWRDPAVITALLGVPEVLRQAREFDLRSRRQLSADGLHPQRVELIVGALDGLVMRQLFGNPPDAAERAALATLLLALTERSDPLVAI
ncbi:TetR/AcrR family transcriptional regulator [Dactylosporangium aurantiacum]|uniref:TetR/AcrR family transcriptional regulator n=1 Tax=Dactylosporangium aurantiacum TaxID=35754 RepID=A0A9Q9MH04_9ACTN|nr:TetR/AcrR family transcriptional regulator [Dactylosporangium aurantiacum]MDG6103928.1 TetR/AcrR family transcriptional regulator [Dactylosporangium aurantiacum]UWZ58883.1 TetR/AcrR family transcriptional regulator [Dactylosporangium aurantiacum]